jgi:pseudaminic acid cytidylyltransferase
MSNEQSQHLAVIPARGGSKRLPRKNIVDFFGKPIIHYTIEAARNAGIFSRILVSTEDLEIAEISKRSGAEVDTRPTSLATDSATIVEVCLELLDRLEKSGERYTTLSVLYATAPLRTSEDIRLTWQLLRPNVCEFAMAVTEFQQPVHQALRMEKDGVMKPIFSESIEKRAAAMGNYFSGNGSTYSVNVAAFRRHAGFYGGLLKGHTMPMERSVDIDTKDDLEMAKFYHERMTR